ncbi:unnamed protein product [Prorocentrum cordatum]|uniref:Uncharacterized protein n=1 Tax=Prorocentrum cordatum TaxID=2364126 RepID=A0ABN9THU0_9DINO|nr:unnamed protein product [Polarella glacialis]
MAARARGRAAARPWLLACRPRALLAAAALAVCCGRLRRGCALAGAGAPRASSAAGAVRGARPHAGAGPRGVAAAAGLAAAREPSQQWGGLTPQGPYFRGGRRKTILRDLVPGQVWSLEQVQGVIYVHVPVRMALVRTSVGLVGYSAVAPTEEMLQLLSRIEEAAGERLAHLILPTTAAEHKLFAVALAQARSDLEFWIVPGQFAFPLNLPNELLGFPIGRTRPLPAQCSDTVAPWAAELPYRVLGPFPSKDGVSTFEELCAFHPASKTLLCVDLVVSVPSDPPSIWSTFGTSLLCASVVDIGAWGGGGLLEASRGLWGGGLLGACWGSLVGLLRACLRSRGRRGGEALRKGSGCCSVVSPS